MNKVQLVIHLRSGQFYDVTDYVSYVKISGATNTETRTLETEFISTYNDFQVSQINTQTGSSMCFYEDGKELYRGNIIDMEKMSGGRTRVTCKDLGFSLSRAKVSKNYKDVKPEDIAKQICKEVRLPQGNFVKTNTKVTRYFRDVSAYDVIMTLYTLASEKTKKQYELEVNINKIEVVERGAVVVIKFGHGDNLYSNTVHESIEDIINNVKVYDKNGNLVNEFMNKDLYKIYNRMSNAVIEIERADMISMEAVKEAYKGEDRTIKISGVGNYDCRSGKRIYVDDVGSNMRGEFYIDSDSHEWSGGTYKCNLELNMTNIMNKKEQGTEELKKEETKLEGFELQMSTGQSGTKDWGHGVTVAQLNKTLRGDCAGYGETVMKYSNMYKVNPAFIVGAIITECGGSPNKPNKKNNPLSNLYGGKYSPYDTMDQGIKAGIRNWSLNYISKTGKYNKGSTTIEQFARTYCPSTASQWARDVRNVIKKTVGKSDVNLGTGVKSDAEANANLVQVAPSPNQNASGNSIIEKAVAYALSRKGMTYSQRGGKNGRNSYFYHTPENARVFDCSSLCFSSYVHAGFLNRSLFHANQNNSWCTPDWGGRAMSRGNKFKRYPLSQAKRGDVLWRDRHAGLYLGNGATIEAASPGEGIVLRPRGARNFAYAYRPQL